METILLKSGVEIPKIGLGTFEISKENFNQIVTDACNFGYRLFNTATGYQNHLELALALKSQEKLQPLICTKFNNGDLISNSNVENVINKVLIELEVKHIDFLLIHNPKVENFQFIFKKLIKLKKDGLVKSIGVSNFTVKHLTLLEEDVEHVDLNEVELHPLLTQNELVHYCKNHNIKIIAYRPFGHGLFEIFENSTLKKIASTHKKTVSQLILRWITQQGHVAIPKASCELHLKQNIDVFDFILSELEINEINSLNKGLRTCTGPWAEFDDEK